MHRPLASLICALVASGGLCACSGDGGLSSLTTSSVSTAEATAPVAPVPRIDPACSALSVRIDTLRREGVADRVEKASVGKTASVSIKRASLAQMAELDKANAEFQSKCSTLGPHVPVQAQVVPAATTATTSPVVTARSIPPVVTTQAPKQ